MRTLVLPVGVALLSVVLPVDVVLEAEYVWIVMLAEVMLETVVLLFGVVLLLAVLMVDVALEIVEVCVVILGALCWEQWCCW